MSEFSRFFAPYNDAAPSSHLPQLRNMRERWFTGAWARKSLTLRYIGSLFGLAIGISLVSGTPAKALEQYRCVVEDFIGFEDDEPFKQKNKRKTFELLVKDKEVVVFSKSRDFKDSEDRYRIIGKHILDLFAIRDGDTIAFSTLAMPSEPARTLERDGYFNATISSQSGRYLNTWLLRCAD